MVVSDTIFCYRKIFSNRLIFSYAHTSLHLEPELNVPHKQMNFTFKEFLCSTFAMLSRKYEESIKEKYNTQQVIIEMQLNALMVLWDDYFRQFVLSTLSVFLYC